MTSDLCNSKELRVYCAVPMWGRAESAIASELESAVSLYSSHTGKSCELVNYSRAHTALSPLEAFGESVKSMAKADVVLMLDGWEEARGCRLEHEIAMGFGVPVVYLCGVRFKGRG